MTKKDALALKAKAQKLDPDIKPSIRKAVTGFSITFRRGFTYTNKTQANAWIAYERGKYSKSRKPHGKTVTAKDIIGGK